MMFRTYTAGGDDQVMIAKGGGSMSKDKNTFKFTGFSNKLHPYYKKQWDWIVKILESDGIFINLKIVPTVQQISKEADKGYLEPSDIERPDNLKHSRDGNTYYCILDEEMGRGWCVLIKCEPTPGAASIIYQDHRDSVLDELMGGDWIRSFGIDYQMVTIADLNNIPE